MRRSNRNFNIPPPRRANRGDLTTFCARGVGNLTFVLASSVLRLDQPNCYAYLDLKGNHLSNVHETQQKGCYRRCY